MKPMKVYRGWCWPPIDIQVPSAEPPSVPYATYWSSPMRSEQSRIGRDKEKERLALIVEHVCALLKALIEV